MASSEEYGFRPVLLENVDLPGWIVLATFDPDAPDDHRWCHMVSLTDKNPLFSVGAQLGTGHSRFWREWDGEITLGMWNGAARSNVR
jgi:hypothetical protein